MPLFRSRLHNINFFRGARFWKKLTFQKSNIPHYLPFLYSFLFRAATFFKDATFCSSYLFRRAIFFTAYFFRKITISQLLFLSRAILLWTTIVTYFRNTYISNGRPSISIKIPSISIKIFGFRSK